MEQKTYGGDIRYGVHSTHLMKMDLLYWLAVDMSLRLGDQPIDRHHILSDFVGDAQSGDNVFYVVETVMGVGVFMIMAARMVMAVRIPLVVGMAVRVLMVMIIGVVVVMLMLMIMICVHALLLVPIHRHTHVGTADAALLHRLRAKDYPGQAQTVEPGHKALRVRMELQQGGGEHIPSSTHITFQIQRFQLYMLLSESGG